jgi:peroxiredoxin Q/BCP
MSDQRSDEQLHGDAMATIERENVGTGSSPISLGRLAARDDIEAIVLLLQRDYHCRQCRQQVQDVAARYDEFQAENAVVVSVLPEPADRARNWQDSYDLPFPLLADPQAEVGESVDQPTRFGRLGQAFDLVGRMPEAIVFDTTDNDLEAVFIHKGTSPGDRPSIEELLEYVQSVTA